jgi:hypothetical protein
VSDFPTFVTFCIKSGKNFSTLLYRIRKNVGESGKKWDKVEKSGGKWENEAGAKAKTET